MLSVYHKSLTEPRFAQLYCLKEDFVADLQKFALGKSEFCFLLVHRIMSVLPLGSASPLAQRVPVPFRDRPRFRGTLSRKFKDILASASVR